MGQRLKYGRVAELLDDYLAANAAIGRAHCPVADYFKAHLDDDILDVEAYVYAHPEWGPQALCESCHATLAFNNARTPPARPRDRRLGAALLPAAPGPAAIPTSAPAARSRRC